MKYVLGIDSGGTKYLVRAAKLDGTPLGGWPMSVMGDEGSGRYVDAWAIERLSSTC